MHGYIWHQHMRSHTRTHKYKQTRVILNGNTASCQCEVLQHKTAVKGMAECANQHYYILLCIKKQI